MHKIKTTLICSNNPLEDKIFEGTKEITFDVTDPHDTEELLEKLEPEIIKLRGDADTTLVMKAQTEDGMTILQGTIGENFNGVAMS
tara:strand:+ start:7696 stop:7953 length:258 start_codon:yes stop_codon:yes gene_type:complete